MKIAMISTPHIPSPPRGYGASELIAGTLAEGLHRRGHTVRLFACPGSSTSVDELHTFPETSYARTYEQRELIHVARALSESQDCDLIHNHCIGAGPAFSNFAAIPFMTTLHYLHPLVFAHPDAPYIAVSDHQRRTLSNVNVVARIHNGIDLRDFPLSRQRDDYLLFLGRFHPNKGADSAIDVAERLGRKLVIAAPAPPDDQRDWFEECIRPRLRGSIEWVGPVEGGQKAALIGRAAASLVPIRWDEPFGLVIIEAMACGTPPIVMRRGAAPEIVVDGVTGFLVDDVRQMIEAVERASTVNPDTCRRHVQENFSVEKMVDGYVRLFENYLMRSCARRTNTKLGTGTPSS